jgi:hypothetical protein
MFRKPWLFCLILLFVFACKQKKKVSLSGDDLVTIGDFIESFRPVNLPFQFTDAYLARNANDSLVISQKVFTQFIPDSALTKVFGKNAKLKIYPLGKVSVEDKETYLFLKVLSNDRKAAYIASFDRKDKFLATMPVLIPDASPATQQSFSFDKRYTVSKIVTRKNPDGTISDGKEVYVLNEDAKAFMLIMTEALDDKNMEVINPIDTLPKRNKFSGDYVKDKRNLVSIRDNKRSDRFVFFIHFEKSNGNCVGDLKGEANFTSSNTAVFRNPGEPCSLQFYFTASSVNIAELQGCGSHRGPNCLFEGNYPRKKEIKKPKKPSKK